MFLKSSKNWPANFPKGILLSIGSATAGSDQALFPISVITTVGFTALTLIYSFIADGKIEKYHKYFTLLTYNFTLLTYTLLYSLILLYCHNKYWTGRGGVGWPASKGLEFDNFCAPWVGYSTTLPMKEWNSPSPRIYIDRCMIS